MAKKITKYLEWSKEQFEKKKKWFYWDGHLWSIALYNIRVHYKKKYENEITLFRIKIVLMIDF